MSSLSIFGLGTSETVLLILHLVLVALCVWHLMVRSGYGEARMRFVLPLIMFMPGAAVLYLLSAREGTVPPDTIKTGSSSLVYFEHRLGFRDGAAGVCRAAASSSLTERRAVVVPPSISLSKISKDMPASLLEQSTRGHHSTRIKV